MARRAPISNLVHYLASLATAGSLPLPAGQPWIGGLVTLSRSNDRAVSQAVGQVRRQVSHNCHLSRPARPHVCARGPPENGDASEAPQQSLHDHLTLGTQLTLFTVSDSSPMHLCDLAHSPAALHRPASETLRRSVRLLFGPQPDLAGLAADPAPVPRIHSFHALRGTGTQPISSRTPDRRSLPLVSPPHRCVSYLSHA